MICILAGIIILTGLTTLMSAERASNQDLPPPSSSVIPVMNAGEEGESGLVKVGLIVEKTHTMEEIHFRRVLENAQSEGFLFHPCETGSSPETQWEMFQKMLGEEYKIIFLSLVDPASAQRYVDAASAQGVYLIFLYNEPPRDLLLSGQGIYYLGFSDADSLREVAKEMGAIWRGNRKLLEYFPDDVLAFASLSDESFEENGKAEKFAAYLKAQGVESTLAKDSVTSMFSFDIHKEIDRIWVAESELLLITSSTEARKALDYLNDPTEFTYNRIEIVVLTADEAAQKMVENGEILMAIGTDGEDLGNAALDMMRALMAGQPPVAEPQGDDPGADRCLYVPGRVVRSPRMDERPQVLKEPEQSSPDSDEEMQPSNYRP